MMFFHDTNSETFTSKCFLKFQNKVIFDEEVDVYSLIIILCNFHCSYLKLK